MSHDRLPYASELLHKSADLFAARNAVYKDNFRMVGRVMKAMFPDGPPVLETEHDYNRWHLFELAIVKLTRYAVNYNAGGHADSIDDMIVYLAMVASLDNEAGFRSIPPVVTAVLSGISDIDKYAAPPIADIPDPTPTDFPVELSEDPKSRSDRFESLRRGFSQRNGSDPDVAHGGGSLGTSNQP